MTTMETSQQNARGTEKKTEKKNTHFQRDLCALTYLRQ